MFFIDGAIHNSTTGNIEFKVILTANVKYFALLALSNGIMDLTFHHTIVIFSRYIRYYLQIAIWENSIKTNEIYAKKFKVQMCTVHRHTHTLAKSWGLFTKFNTHTHTQPHFISINFELISFECDAFNDPENVTNWNGWTVYTEQKMG